MEMSIEKSMNELKTKIRYYKDFWGADASDYVIDVYNTAIDTMRKYQKIQEILKAWNDMNSFDSMAQISEVVEDGND